MVQIGDQIRDNDPRRNGQRVLEVKEILPDGRVRALDPAVGKKFRILRRRIYTDGKPRHAGFTWMPK